MVTFNTIGIDLVGKDTLHAQLRLEHVYIQDLRETKRSNTVNIGHSDKHRL